MGKGYMANPNYHEIPVLDGYVRLVGVWGSDQSIIESARMSTNKGFCGWGTPDEPGDEKLLKYLYTNKHMTPFEMAGLTIEVKAPIMVFREWHRHRTQSYNEMSGRYVPLPHENYIPSFDRAMSGMLAARTSKNKQAQAAVHHGPTPTSQDAENIRMWLGDLADVYNTIQNLYESALARGIPKELARLPLPVGRYSAMRASANLRNWLGFLALRMPDSAQWEIRQYANAVGKLISLHFPRTWELFQGSVE